VTTPRRRRCSRRSASTSLLTNNPDKARQLVDLGVGVRRTTSTGVFATDSNLRYLHAKVEHTQHDIDLAGLAGLVG
jgi:GTP cyclohydrolase II